MAMVMEAVRAGNKKAVETEHALDFGAGGQGHGCVVEDGQHAEDGEGDADVGYYVCC